jgi:hypothetical protein
MRCDVMENENAALHAQEAAIAEVDDDASLDSESERYGRCYLWHG